VSDIYARYAEDDIIIFENTLSKQHCGEIISLFNREDIVKPRTDTMIEEGGKHYRFSDIYGESSVRISGHPDLAHLDRALFNSIGQIVAFYRQEYDGLYPDLELLDTGYHAIKYAKDVDWGIEHFDSPVEMYQGRITTKIVTCVTFLNDVEEGGEIAFPRLKKSFPPKAGTTISFPVGITHPHMINPSLSGDRYVVITWIAVRYRGVDPYEQQP
jgi:hypothetical protein